MGSTSGRPINTTSFPRDCSFRASAVMGFRCPVTGTLTKPNFILALPAGHLDGPRHLAKATMHGLLHHEPVFRYKEHAWSSFIPGCAEDGLEHYANQMTESLPTIGRRGGLCRESAESFCRSVPQEINWLTDLSS